MKTKTKKEYNKKKLREIAQALKEIDKGNYGTPLEEVRAKLRLMK